MNVLETVTGVVAEVLEVDPAEVSPSARLVEDLGMDSVLAIDITTGLEKAYKIRVPEDRMPDYRTVSDIVAIVEELLASKGASA